MRTDEGEKRIAAHCAVLFELEQCSEFFDSCFKVPSLIRGEEKIGLNLFYRLNSGRYRTRNVDRDLATLPQLPDLKK